MSKAEQNLQKIASRIEKLSNQKKKELDDITTAIRKGEDDLRILKPSLETALEEGNESKVQKLVVEVTAKEKIIEAKKKKLEEIDFKSYLTEEEYNQFCGSASAEIRNLEKEELEKLSKLLPKVSEILDHYKSFVELMKSAKYEVRYNLYRDENFVYLTDQELETLAKREADPSPAMLLPIDLFKQLKSAIEDSLNR